MKSLPKTLVATQIAFCLLILSAFSWVFADSGLAQPRFPPLKGRIVDEASLIKPQDRAQLEADLQSLETKSSDQIVVYTTKSLQGYPIEDFGYQLGRTWAIGQGSTNNGVILIIAPTERKVRIEVGRGLEGQLTDLMSRLIIENAILPPIRRGEFSEGIKAGVRDIRDVLLGDAEAVKQRAASRKPLGRKAQGNEALVTLIVIVIALVVVFGMQARYGSPAPLSRGRRTRDGGIVFAPVGWGHGGGGRGSGGGDGGGFSGGGGDFGGGGGSGSW